MKRAACFLAIAGLAATPAHGQAQRPSVKTATAGVLIDVTVLDQKGQPIFDLAPGDFELSEEGKRQEILSVTLVQGGVVRSLAGSSPLDMPPGQPVAGTAERASSDQPRSAENTPTIENTPTVTAIVFDKVSPEGMPYAVRAAHAYASTLAPPRDYAGIFLADLSLRVFEPFTNDPERLRAAIDRMGVTATASMRPETQRAGDTLIRPLDPNTPPTASAEFSSGGFPGITERERTLASMDPATRMMAQMMWRMEKEFRQIVAEYEGQTSLAGLRSVVDALALLAGRKSILYFTENLPLTDRGKPKFEALIGQANRANITFYPVDAAGLRLHSKEAELSRNVNLAGSQGIGDTKRDEGPWTKELERQDQLLVSRPTAVLGRLAKDTGGFVIENTNDLSAGVARMRQERTTYYLLGYQPANATMDGKFRRVSVKVKRSKVSVRARPGYLATPAPAPPAR
jgi:VWFA-related protein